MTTRRPWHSLARLTWRESRTMRSRLLLYMSSVSLGIGALVAIDSFSANVRASVADSSRSLLGGDLALLSRQPLATTAAQLADSLRQSGAREAQVTTFPSMAAVHRTGRTRLAQIRAVSDAYPLAGQVETDPATAWPALHAGERAIVDPSLLATLDAQVGDSLTLGYSRFQIVGTIRSVPGDAGIAAAIGPRVFISSRDLDATRLLVLGARADYKTLIALRTGSAVPERWLARERRGLAPQRVRIQTVADAEANLTTAIGRLTDFLGVLGVVALLLGGIGVASGITAFVARKIEAAAILRCLGATGWQVLAIYLTQAAAMGLVGAGIGVVLGAAIQVGLPSAVRDFLPLGVTIELVPRAMLIGLATGLWIALLFAIRPLLALRRISPLQALRRHVETHGVATGTPGRRDPAVWAATVAIAATVLGIAVARAPVPRTGVATAAGIAVVLGILWLAAGLLAAVARRVPRARWPYVVRQGIANLHRPANQTRAVVLALGFGVFLISTLALVQSALLHEFTATTASSRANLLFFDVQDDQAHATDSIIRAGGYSVIEQTPIVTMRIAAINGTAVSVAAVDPGDAADTTDSAAPAPATAPQTTRRGRRAGPRRAAWALRREYRSTYRDTLVGSERLVAGKWIGRAAAGDSIAPISLETDVAKELGVTIGDRVTWDVQGVPVQTRIASLRDVDWARFEPNFFAVFPAGVLEHAPKQYVFLADVPGAAATAGLQRTIGERYPNISSVDLSLIRDTVNGILQKITLAIRFLSIFCLLMGIPVLFSAVAATRRERIRESVLLKTLGASRAQVTRIMVAEYAMLGVLASVAGTVLSAGGAWLLVHFVFETPFVPAVVPPVVIALASAALTIVIGVAGSRSAFASTPLEMLRAE